MAPCDDPFGPCGDGCLCLGYYQAGRHGYACLQAAEGGSCTEEEGFRPCAWDFEAGLPSCPKPRGHVCTATGICQGPEEVCLPLCPPSLTF